MEVSQDRFAYALKNIRLSEWERFERLASTFLSSEWPGIRTMASQNGDGGRDSELFSTAESPNIVFKYSIEDNWKEKIRKTITRIKTTFPNVQMLVYLSSKTIGAQQDAIKKEAFLKNIYLDIRDVSWFVESVNKDDNRKAAGNDFARAVVDPLMEKSIGLTRSLPTLTRHESNTALLFLEMQLHDQNVNKGLTKSSFEALVRGALHGTSDSNRVTRDQIYARVSSFLPRHQLSQLIPFIDAALKRMTKTSIKHHNNGDQFHIDYHESERIKGVAASIQALKDEFDADVDEIVSFMSDINASEKPNIANNIQNIVESYFLRKGEEFAASLARDVGPPISDADLKSIVIEMAPRNRLSSSRDNIAIIMNIIKSILSQPSEATKEYLQLLSDSYTLFSFLEEAPDVQRVTSKLFNHGEIWLDTSVLLPIFAEQKSTEIYRPFTSLFKQAKVSGIKLFVTIGIIEEIERHLNRCLTFTRSQSWSDRVPYVYAQYIIAGGTLSEFPGWLEQFYGANRPEDDIADYIFDEFGIVVERAVVPTDVDQNVVQAILEYWKGVHESRRNDGNNFSINANRLAEHDAEMCLTIFQKRRGEVGKSHLGYASWYLTLDGAARRMSSKIDPDIWAIVKHTPVISVDFLMRYIAFGPCRDRLTPHNRCQAQIFSASILDSIPKDVLEVAQRVRAENVNLSEKLVQRRIRDALDCHRMNVGPIQQGGLDGMSSAIKDIF